MWMARLSIPHLSCRLPCTIMLPLIFLSVWKRLPQDLRFVLSILFFQPHWEKFCLGKSSFPLSSTFPPRLLRRGPRQFRPPALLLIKIKIALFFFKPLPNPLFLAGTFLMRISSLLLPEIRWSKIPSPSSRFVPIPIPGELGRFQFFFSTL